MPAREWWFWSKVFAAVSVTVLLFIVGALLWMPAIVDKRSDRAKLDLFNLKGAFSIAASRDGGTPKATTFEALVDAGILDQVPHDPWGDRYCVIPDEGVLIICTLGSDGEPGGAESAQDLCVRSPGPRHSVEINPREARACAR